MEKIYTIQVHLSENKEINITNVLESKLHAYLDQLKQSELIMPGTNGLWIPREKISYALIVEMNISPDPCEPGQPEVACEVASA